MARVMGIDAAAGQWLAICLEDGRYAGALLRPTVAELLEAEPNAARVAIDIPIGLPVGRLRPADAAARTLVGRRSSSVFDAPPREVLEAVTHAEATALAKRTIGIGVSRQAHGLAARILEVDRLVAVGHPLFEAHPEVSFSEMARKPPRASKHSWAGIAERRQLLLAEGIELPDDLPGGERVRPDDVVDAAAVAWTAHRLHAGTARTVPAYPSSDPDDGGVINV